MNWLRGFKVVRKFTLPDATTTFRSYIKDVCEGGVTYAVGEITRPRAGCGPLAVFADKATATNFVQYFVSPQNRHKYHIMPCKFVASEYTKLWCSEWEWYDNVPSGTRFADAVELEAE